MGNLFFQIGNGVNKTFLRADAIDVISINDGGKRTSVSMNNGQYLSFENDDAKKVLELWNAYSDACIISEVEAHRKSKEVI